MPCDLLLMHGQVKVSSYLEIMDAPHREMLSYNNMGRELPESATSKRGSDLKPDEQKHLIIDSERYVPMGVRVISGTALGICIL